MNIISVSHDLDPDQDRGLMECLSWSESKPLQKLSGDDECRH